MKIETIIVIILALILRRIYHALFRVVYVNPFMGVIREFVICLLISAVIVYTATNKLNLKVFEKENDTSQGNNISQTDDTKGIGGLFQRPGQKEKEKRGYMGTFYNLEFLNGSGFETMLAMEESYSIDNGVHIDAYAGRLGTNVIQNYSFDMPCPEGNVLTFTISLVQKNDCTITVT